MNWRTLFPTTFRRQIRLWQRQFADQKSGIHRRFAQQGNFKNPPAFKLHISQPVKVTSGSANKVENLRIATARVAKIIIQPAEVFSFWKVVGAPSPKNGYKKGRNIINDKLQEDYGGGLCQLSGIMYHLCLQAGLKIVERHHHSLDIYQEKDRYTPLGSDATVVYGYKDFRIENNFDFPIQFSFNISVNQLTINLLSSKKIKPMQLHFERKYINGYEHVETQQVDLTGIKKQIATSIYRKIHFSILLFLALFLTQCQSPNTPTETTTKSTATSTVIPEENLPKQDVLPPTFERTKLLEKLRQKVTNNTPLVAHIFVPLCDNEHQGIVPVSTALGNGQNLKTNLYWGALYGIKTHFKRSKDWKLIENKSNISFNVLERVIFHKKFGNGASVYLVADAYRGDRMQACLQDYFNALAGKKQTQLTLIDGTKINSYSQADLLGFNGHNGLMDVTVPSVANIDNQYRDALVIGCISYDYFNEHLLKAKAYPLVTTTNLMAPEAYVLEGILNAWANLEEGETVRKNAGKYYHKYQKCGLKGATRLFKTGWD